MADIKYNYKLNIKGVLAVDADGKMFVSVEDGPELNLATLFEDFDGKLVKIGVQYDEDYEADTSVDEETGEVID